MLPRLRALFFATGGGREPVSEDIALAEARWKEWRNAEGQ